MARKSAQKTQEELYGPAKLTKQKSEFKSTLLKRKDIGNELIEKVKNIKNEDDYNSVKLLYDKRNNWNAEYFKISFNYEDNRYYKEYSYRGGGVISMGPPNLYEEVKDSSRRITRRKDLSRLAR